MPAFGQRRDRFMHESDARVGLLAQSATSTGASEGACARAAYTPKARIVRRTRRWPRVR